MVWLPPRAEAVLEMRDHWETVLAVEVRHVLFLHSCKAA